MPDWMRLFWHTNIATINPDNWQENYCVLTKNNWTRKSEKLKSGHEIILKKQK